MLTYLAIVFVVLLLGSVLYGFSIIMRRPPTDHEMNTERCSLCRERFEKTKLIERPIGDYKVLYFCAACITKLSNDAKTM